MTVGEHQTMFESAPRHRDHPDQRPAQKERTPGDQRKDDLPLGLEQVPEDAAEPRGLEYHLPLAHPLVHLDSHTAVAPEALEADTQKALAQAAAVLQEEHPRTVPVA